MKFFFPTIFIFLHFASSNMASMVSAPSIGSDGNDFVRIADTQTVDGRLTGVPKLEMLAATDDCNEDAVKRDFGTACLKKAIVTSHDDGVLDSRNSPQTPTSPANLNRHFVVRPMLSSQDGVRAPAGFNRPSGFKSPALNARELYEAKGYKYPTKSVKTISGVDLNTSPLSPSNKFYNMNKNRLRPNPNSITGTPVIRKGPTRNSIGENVEPGVPISFDQEPERSIPTNQKFSEELEMLQSLKRSLGVLSAQALNLKQRTQILYREARSKKLTFFDSLLSRTATFLNDKLEETRSAIDEIDTTMEQIRQHQQGVSMANLRRTLFKFSLGNQVVMNQNTVQRVNRPKPKRAVPKIDQNELDQLISDMLKHAQKMMNIIRELNEALDEFEEQFNLARFEPNTIDDNTIETSVPDEEF